MMVEKRLKYTFYFSSALLLILMLIMSKNAGISCDEMLHYEQSVYVYNFFATHGQDQSAVDTPVTHLKYYGQSYDNIATIITKWLHIDDVYLFRNYLSAIAGWLAIFLTALFAIRPRNFKAGIFVLALFAVSPAFIGHSMNNLKDIPFALGYITGIFLILEYFFAGSHKLRNSVLLTISVAFAISIRAGGLILICYLFLLFFIFWFLKFVKDHRLDLADAGKNLLRIFIISLAAWLLGTLLWPFALQSPFKNVIESYKVMAHFPGTFRQIFEGRVEWSDFMPWYYIPKSMLITIPLIVTAGFILFFFIHKYKSDLTASIKYAFIVFTILFPLFFVIYERSNVYSSWRQFLFLYPGIVLISATGLSRLHDHLRNSYYKTALIIVVVLLSFHPLKYMVRNPQLAYIYYNQLTGGVKGAYSNYELDYYFVSQTEASKWLIDYIGKNKPGSAVDVKATYPVDWQFRSHPEIKTSFFRYEEKSLSDWDYAIVTNRYIPPFKLKNKTWPPDNAIHIIYADKVPVCAVLERKTKEDYEGFVALNEGRNKDAIGHFENATKVDVTDEMIFYNFGAALFKDGQYMKADSVLKKALEINPDFEPALMYLGNIAKSQNKQDEAAGYYEKLIKANRKYFEAYPALAELLKNKDVNKARRLLKTCLDMNPGYKPAIMVLADTYRKSDPEIARKYDDLISTMK